MAIWLPYKAKAYEQQTWKKKPYERQRLCKICGNIATNGSLCQSCSDFIRQKKNEERRAKNEH